MTDIIHLLPDSVANQIAAGEVVDRPSSVVKELVENSIDAGATDIAVIIKDSGKTLIQVVDNGKGMSETDARMAFERHATSKISSAADLYSLQTMGFRGEALASIAAIAQIDLRTRREGDEMGVFLQIEGSKFVTQEPVACAVGSSFAVKNLFFNTPARRRFLKSDATEFGHIITVFNRIALVYPNVSFSLFHNDVEMSNYAASNQAQRIVDVFGKKLKTQLLPVDIETDVVKISGYVCRPESATKTSANQYFFVNGRFMWHPSFNKAVLQAYDRMLPAGTYPGFYIFLQVDPKTLDVNIHRSGVAEIVKAPDLVEKLISCENAVIVGSQEVKQFKLLGGDINALAVELEFILLLADLDVFELDNLIVIGIVMGIATAENRLDACEEFAHIKGFNNEIVGAKLETYDLINDLALSGDHNDRLVCKFAEFCANVFAVLTGKHNIKENKIGSGFAKKIYRLRTA